jgi:hypothetical protein
MQPAILSWRIRDVGLPRLSMARRLYPRTEAGTSCLALMPPFCRLEASSDDELPDAHSRRIARLLEFETESRGRPKALCYEDIKVRLHDSPTYTMYLYYCDSCRLSATRRLAAILSPCRLPSPTTRALTTGQCRTYSLFLLHRRSQG